MYMPVWLMLVVVALALFGYMSVWFVFARYEKRVDVIDAAWGLGFIYVALVAMLIAENRQLVQWLAFGFTGVWGSRLFIHIARRLAKHEEDPRYGAYRKKWAKHFWRTAYMRIFLLQAALLFAVSTPLVAIMTGTFVYSSTVMTVGFSLWGFGILFETMADRQLRTFLANNKQPAVVMDKGLWRYSRHPNYFGEITTWVGAATVAISMHQWWGIIGAVTIVILITKVSGIPPLEKSYADDAAYQDYKKHTSVLIPLPRR